MEKYIDALSEWKNTLATSIDDSREEKNSLKNKRDELIVKINVVEEAAKEILNIFSVHGMNEFKSIHLTPLQEELTQIKARLLEIESNQDEREYARVLINTIDRNLREEGLK